MHMVVLYVHPDCKGVAFVVSGCSFVVVHTHLFHQKQSAVKPFKCLLSRICARLDQNINL